MSRFEATAGKSVAGKSVAGETAARETAAGDAEIADASPRRSRRFNAHAVHLLTASGIVPAALAMYELTRPSCDPKIVFGLLLLTTLIDAVDGPLARRFQVKRYAASIDGRTIDDLLDYLTFAFIPLMLIWRMQWLPVGLGWTTVIPMIASLFGFANVNAKDESGGFFRGFPSYWNVFAFYGGILSTTVSPWLTVVLMWLLAILTVSPVWFLYPNLTPGRWKPWVLGGAGVWALLMLAMLVFYPRPPVWLSLVSLVYPCFYVFASSVCYRKKS